MESTSAVNEKQSERSSLDELNAAKEFVGRHIGPSTEELREMVRLLGLGSVEELITETVPESVLRPGVLDLPDSRSEADVMAELKRLASANQVYRSYIGLGYAASQPPPVVLRNVLENPGWYTAYTPYQAEISQGRLEALVNFQTMVIDLTGMEIANASLLDEATAAAEGMALCRAVERDEKRNRFWVSSACLPQTIDVVRTRARPLGIEVSVGEESDFEFDGSLLGVLLQYPAADGSLSDPSPTIDRARQAGAKSVVAADLLSLVLLRPPGEMGADVVVGNTQRFGVPLGFGGPHAAYFATREAYKRAVPGRMVGVSRDAEGRNAYRLALQTREQHIRRERATSNICTAQVLLAVMASMYAVYHGPAGLTKISSRVHRLTAILAEGLRRLGSPPRSECFFDTLAVPVGGRFAQILGRAEEARINLRRLDNHTLGVSLDETTLASDLQDLWRVFSGDQPDFSAADLDSAVAEAIPEELRRETPILAHPVFNSYHSETEMLRYLHRLQSRDLSLTHSMIPLGSCTMKLNATAEMLPVSLPGFAGLHPFAPVSQASGYLELIRGLEGMLSEITGFSGVSLQPNAGSQGEYAGLLMIRRFHESRGEGSRDVCLIPSSAHGTNPASASMAGLKVVVVPCDEGGNVDLEALAEKARTHQDRLAVLMITYPSTHGVFEPGIRQMCEIVHRHGGQVYLDGANLNALVGLCQPAELGVDVAHLNLHKSFCIPHGGGGPGVGPVGVAPHLEPFLPNHPLVAEAGPSTGIGPISAAPWGSAGILPISWAYIALMGGNGLLKATQVAILNANYIAARLADHYPILYSGRNGRVAHECIVDLRPLKASAGVDVDDVAKRLMDFGFHAPTMSWPVAGTLMIEPTESESKEELDRFCDAMIAIRREIRLIEEGRYDQENNPLKNAPHTADSLLGEWDRPYTRQEAVHPLPWVRERKFWPSVARIDNAYGDRNFFCSCPPWGDE